MRDNVVVNPAVDLTTEVPLNKCGMDNVVVHCSMKELDYLTDIQLLQPYLWADQNLVVPNLEKQVILTVQN